MTAVQSFYRDRTVFITGGTGFIGKIIIEKLLRWASISAVWCSIGSFE